MDSQRFDHLTLRFATLLSRRRFGLRLAGLVLMSGLGAPVESEARRKKRKKKKRKKCKAGAVRCGKTCVNTNTSAVHCGGCGRRCGGGETCQGGQCQQQGGGCGSGGTCRVFATSLTYDGNLGGLAGADQKCNDRARAAGLPGSYRAWLSDSTGSPSSRFVPSTGPYVLVTGARIADNWDDLTDDDPEHRLDQEINRDELGNEITPAALSRVTWTNTKPDGTLNSETHHCQNWSTSQGTPNFGSAGNVNATDSFWTYATSIFCNNPGQRLYCFQQR